MKIALLIFSNRRIIIIIDSGRRPFLTVNIKGDLLLIDLLPLQKKENLGRNPYTIPYTIPPT